MSEPIVIHAAGKVYQVIVHEQPHNGYFGQALDLESGEVTTDAMNYPTEREALRQLRQILELQS